MNIDNDGVLTILKMDRNTKKKLKNLALHCDFLTPIEKKNQHKFFHVKSVSGETLKIVQTIDSRDDLVIYKAKKKIENRKLFLKVITPVIPALLSGITGGVLVQLFIYFFLTKTP